MPTKKLYAPVIAVLLFASCGGKDNGGGNPTGNNDPAKRVKLYVEEVGVAPKSSRDSSISAMTTRAGSPA